MPVPSIVTSAKAAAKAYRLRVSIESITQGIEASRLRPGDGSGVALSSEDSAIVAGVPVWRLTDPTLHNLCNAPGFAAAPSQTTKLVLR